MCSGASSSTGLPPLRASVLESLYQNEAVAWQRRKRKAPPTAPVPSPKDSVNGTSKHFLSILSFGIHSQQSPTVARARVYHMRRPFYVAYSRPYALTRLSLSALSRMRRFPKFLPILSTSLNSRRPHPLPQIRSKYNSEIWVSLTRAIPHTLITWPSGP